MTISVEKLRQLLARPPSGDSARVLKEWRAQTGYSQVEAAIRLGVPVRTLQGWELGRPMPYPTLLHKAVSSPSRSRGQYSVDQLGFPREFAEFIDFVGAGALDKETVKIEKKLRGLSPGARDFYGDRYFFQEQCLRFTEDIPAFGLDISDAIAVRTASLIAGINRVRQSLSATGTSRFRSMVISNLKLGNDMRQIEHEVRCATHFALKSLKVVFADLEGAGNFDLLVGSSSSLIEVECKTIAQDTGSQLKSDLVVSMLDSFVKMVSKKIPTGDSGIFTVTLNKAADHCKNLTRQLEQTVELSTAHSCEADDFRIEFSPQLTWQRLLNSQHWTELDRQIKVSADDGEYARGTAVVPGKVFVMEIRAHSPSIFADRLVKTVKNAADQCSGTRPGVVWLHFVGLAEQDFQTLCDFSLNGPGTGLNAIVAQALDPKATTTDRTHIQLVRFSCDSGRLNRQPVLDSNLVLSRAVSRSGPCYDVPNPRSRFAKHLDL